MALASIRDTVAMHAALRPQHQAVLQTWPVRASVTFPQLVVLVDRVAALIPRGKTVAVVDGPCIAMLALYMACLVNDCVLVPLPLNSPDFEILAMMQGLSVDLLLLCSERKDLAHRVTCPTLEFNLALDFNSKEKVIAPLNSGNERGERSIALNRPWVILHTSGTTRRRGVIRSELATVLGALVHQQALCLSPADSFLATWPIHGISTFFFSFAALYMGGRVVLAPPGASPDLVSSLLREERISFTTGPPSLLCSLAQPRASYPDLRRVLCSGAPLTPGERRLLLRSYPAPCQVWQAYGSTEAGVVTLQALQDAEEGVGYPPPGCPPLYIDSVTREVLVSRQSPMFMLGYVDPESSPPLRTDGMFGMGDEGSLSDNAGPCGLIVKGRLDDRINLASGIDFQPQEVEMTLMDALPEFGHPYVFYSSSSSPEAAGVSMVVVGCRLPCAEAAAQAKQVLEERVAAHKRPRSVVFVERVEEACLTATRKVKRNALAGFVQGKKSVSLT